MKMVLSSVPIPITEPFIYIMEFIMPLYRLPLLNSKGLCDLLCNNHYPHFRDGKPEVQSFGDLIVVKAQLAFSWTHPELVLRSPEFWSKFLFCFTFLLLS